MAAFAAADSAADAELVPVFVVGPSGLVATGDLCSAEVGVIACYAEDDAGNLTLVYSTEASLVDSGTGGLPLVDGGAYGWYVRDGEWLSPFDSTAATASPGGIAVDDAVAQWDPPGYSATPSLFGLAWPFVWGTVVVLIACAALVVVARRRRTRRP